MLPLNQPMILSWASFGTPWSPFTAAGSSLAGRTNRRGDRFQGRGRGRRTPREGRAALSLGSLAWIGPIRRLSRAAESPPSTITSKGSAHGSDWNARHRGRGNARRRLRLREEVREVAAGAGRGG